MAGAVIRVGDVMVTHHGSGFNSRLPLGEENARAECRTRHTPSGRYGECMLAGPPQSCGPKADRPHTPNSPWAVDPLCRYRATITWRGDPAEVHPAGLRAKPRSGLNDLGGSPTSPLRPVSGSGTPEPRGEGSQTRRRCIATPPQSKEAS